MKNVIVTTLHEDEQALAGTRLTRPVQSDDGLVEGAASDEVIDELRQAGLLVEVLPALADIQKAGFTLQSNLRSVSGPLPPTPAMIELATSGPIRAEWLDALRNMGVRRIERSGGDRLAVYIDDAPTLAAIAAEPWVCGVRTLAGPKPIRVAPSDGTRSGAPSIETEAAWDVRLSGPGDAQEVIDWARGQGFTVVGSSSRRVRLRLPIGQAHLLDDAGFESTPYIEPTFHNDCARADIGHATPAQVFVGANPFSLTGSGQVVGVADSGLDEQHPDFTGRVSSVVARGRTGDASDVSGHGTHVAGSILGDGAASGGKYAGIAPGATLFFQSVADANGALSGIPVDLGELFGEAHAAGARIHNDSWGSAVQSRYVGTSEDVDDFVLQHPDMLVVISAGNDGTSVVDPNLPSRLEPGRVQPLSLGAPATSKNALVVGAARSSRKQGGLSQLTNGAAFLRFPLLGVPADVAAEPVSGDVEQLAAFSSRGPCDDRRIKPDVVAPGTDIISTRSALAADDHFWAPLQGERYAYMGGTSMAAPIVSGFAALVREYYITHRQVPDPSAALIKATIINGTRVLRGGDAGGPIPNAHQGFGCVHLATTLPSTASTKLAFTDVLAAQGFTRVRERRRFTFRTVASGDLRVCLTFLDPAARSLQNDLDLIVEVPGLPRRKILGNEALRDRLTQEDSENNVEIVRVPSAPIGTWTLAVVCRNLIRGPQGFALVVLGELADEHLIVS